MLSDSASSYDDDKRLWCKILICPAFLKGGTSQSFSDPHNQIETRIIIIIIMWMWKDKAPPSAPTAATAFIRIEHFDHRSSRPAAAAHTAAGQNKRPLSDSFFFLFLSFPTSQERKHSKDALTPVSSFAGPAQCRWYYNISVDLVTKTVENWQIRVIIQKLVGSIGFIAHRKRQKFRWNEDFRPALISFLKI